MSEPLVITFLTLGIVLMVFGRVGQVTARVSKIRSKNRAVWTVASLTGLSLISLSLLFLFAPSQEGPIPATGGTPHVITGSAEVTPAATAAQTITVVATKVAATMIAHSTSTSTPTSNLFAVPANRFSVMVAATVTRAP